MSAPTRDKCRYTRIVIAASLVVVASCAGSTPPLTTPLATSHSAPSIDGPSVRVVELPVSTSGDQDREVTVLVDEPALELVSIVLRRGTVLPEHHSEVPVTIQVLRGAATVDAAGQQLRIDPSHAIVLAAKVPHAVRPDPGTDVVLLVSHLGRPTHHAEGN